MQTLTVASKANGGLVLPALLAATYLSRCRPDDAISIEYKDVESYRNENAKAILTTNDGKSIVDGSVIMHVVDEIRLPRGVRKNEVCLADLPKLFSDSSHPFLDHRMAGSLDGTCSP